VTYSVVLAGTARRDLRKVPPRIAPAIIEFIYGDLSRAPTRVGKPLQRELEGVYAARRGPYRILYRIDHLTDQIKVVRIDHRAEAYRPTH